MTARRLSRANAARPPPRPSSEPVTVQRRASNTGVIMIVGQKSALGRNHAGQIVTVHVAEHTVTIDLGGDDTHASLRTTTQAVRSIKPTGPQGQNHSCLLGHLSASRGGRFVNIRSDWRTSSRALSDHLVKLHI